LITSRHWPIVNGRGEVVAPSCKLRFSGRLSDLPMARSTADVTCRRCLASDRYKDVVREEEERQEVRRRAREERAVLLLIERHREEFEELLTNEAVLDVLEGGAATPDGG
jgi:hypothetical protein